MNLSISNIYVDEDENIQVSIFKDNENEQEKDEEPLIYQPISITLTKEEFLSISLIKEKIRVDLENSISEFADIEELMYND